MMIQDKAVNKDNKITKVGRMGLDISKNAIGIIVTATFAVLSVVWLIIQILSYNKNRPNIKFNLENYNGDITVWHSYYSKGANLNNPIKITVVNINPCSLLIKDYGITEASGLKNNIDVWVKRSPESAINSNLTNANPFYYYVDRKDLEKDGLISGKYIVYIRDIVDKEYKSKIKLPVK